MKNKLGTYIFVGLFYVIALSCGGGSDDDEMQPKPDPVNLAPTAVSSLIYPTSNLLCIDNIIPFDWSDATDPENDAIKYRITVASDRNLTQIVENQIIPVSKVTINLQKGKAFYWNVIAIDSKNNESPATTTQAFYTSGNGISNHAPFSATSIAPENESNINAGTISLTWEGNDADVNDVLSYDLYFGEASDPPILQTDMLVETFDVAVETGKTYYWKVNTIDDSGAKTIGQVWEFTVN